MTSHEIWQAREMLFIVGVPRSGTSWLAKIFDSHPKVVYRHEPDTILRTTAIPAYCGAGDIDTYLPAARSYLNSLLEVRVPKTVGSRPIFKKDYYGNLSFLLRNGMILAAKAAERIGPFRGYAQRVRIPDLIDIRQDSLRVVIKSINALGRVTLFLRAWPGSKAIIIVRHPCGQVSSLLRGIERAGRNAQLPATVDFGIYELLAETDQAIRRGLSLEVFKRMKPIERLAWLWAIMNEKAIEELEGSPIVRILKYEELCEAPEKVARELFDFAGLPWNNKTQVFLRASVEYRGHEGYYDVFRDTRKAAYKWREELSADEISDVLNVANQTRAGLLFK